LEQAKSLYAAKQLKDTVGKRPWRKVHRALHIQLLVNSGVALA